MHFSIPDTTVFVYKSSSFTGFNVHINGSFHACLRYKQLHSLHEQLRRLFPNIMLPPFPSKKLFPLGSGQLEDRRIAIQNYLQLIGSDPTFAKSELLLSFLLTAQQESAAVEPAPVTMDVYLMNGQRVPVQCSTTDYSSKLLELVCKALDLPREYTYFFALFLLRKDEQTGEVVVFRKLMDFEAPLITLKNIAQTTGGGARCKCVLRKCYWDPAYDLEVMRDTTGLNLLYTQTVSEEPGLAASSQTREELASLQARGNKREYMDIARGLPNYGTIAFTDCTVDYPVPETKATVIIGNREITFVGDCDTATTTTAREMKFRVTRIRCWKITTIHDASQSGDEPPVLELSFEFLMSKNYLKWIQIRSEKAMMLTVCLQCLVSELLNQKSDTNNLKTSQSSKQSSGRIVFVRRDETKQFKVLPQPEITGDSDSAREAVTGEENRSSTVVMQKRTVKDKLREMSTSVFGFKNGQNRVHNEAFEGIGDEDL